MKKLNQFYQTSLRMSNRLPQIFLNTPTILTSSGIKKKQGGIFELHLEKNNSSRMNETFTAGIREKHYKTSLQKKTIQDTESNYRTLTLRGSQYEIPGEKRLLTSHLSLYRSARLKSFSLQKNPEAFSIIKEKEQVENVTTMLTNRCQELIELQFKMTPFKFVACEYRKDLERIRNNFQREIEQIEEELGSAIRNMRIEMTSLRKQTGNEIKVNKVELNKYQDQINMFQEMADQLPNKMDTIDENI